MTLISGKTADTLEMAIRMNVDLCFDHTEATRGFWFFAKAVYCPAGEIRENESRSSSSPHGWRLANTVMAMTWRGLTEIAE